MNGGDTSITRASPTLTKVRSWGLRKGGRLQIYAPITNENIYTNLWHGRSYGFERVIETFEMTDAPRRLKAVDIYYHSYSTSKQASIKALHKVYGWALSHQLHPVYSSEYIRKVQDFYDFAVGKDEQGWRLGGPGRLRTLRMPPSLGVPVLSGSSGIAGYAKGVDGHYLHLATGAARLAARDAGTEPASRPYLIDSNARITSWQEQADGSVRFALQGACATGAAHVPAARLHARRGEAFPTPCQWRRGQFGPARRPLLQKYPDQCPTPSAMRRALNAPPRFLHG